MLSVNEYSWRRVGVLNAFSLAYWGQDLEGPCESWAGDEHSHWQWDPGGLVPQACEDGLQTGWQCPLSETCTGRSSPTQPGCFRSTSSERTGVCSRVSIRKFHFSLRRASLGISHTGSISSDFMKWGEGKYDISLKKKSFSFPRIGKWQKLEKLQIRIPL